MQIVKSKPIKQAGFDSLALKLKDMEIKIDRTTLPKDGQKVKWQTQEDMDERVWKEGRFCEGDDLFCVGFEDTASKWNISWEVIQWEPI